jgi:hypothetical protein
MDIANLEYLLQRKSFDSISEKNSDSKILFCTGIGVNSRPEIPIRFFAYLLPLVAAVHVFQEARGQFYIADQAAVRIGYDPEVVRYNAGMTVKAIREFVGTFYPHIAARIYIACEKKSENEFRFVREERQKLTEQLIADLLEVQDPKILRFARKRSQASAVHTSLQYIAEHALFMRDPVTTDERLFLVGNPDDFQFETLAMVGGPSEKFFYKARKILLKKYSNIHNNFKNIQLFTKIGRIPAYYDRFGEPVISETLTEDDVQRFLLHVHPELFTDYKILIAACADFPRINIRKNNIAQLPKSDLERLQYGFIMLKRFLQQFKTENLSYLNKCRLIKQRHNPALQRTGGAHRQ